MLVITFYSSPVAYWTSLDQGAGSSSFGVIYFCLLILSVGFCRQEYWNGCRFLLRWTMFCQNSSLWPVHLVSPCMAWLIASLSYESPFTTTRLWSMKGKWALLKLKGFCTVKEAINKTKRQPAYWEKKYLQMMWSKRDYFPRLCKIKNYLIFQKEPQWGPAQMNTQ